MFLRNRSGTILFHNTQNLNNRFLSFFSIMMTQYLQKEQKNETDLEDWVQGRTAREKGIRGTLRRDSTCWQSESGGSWPGCTLRWRACWGRGRGTLWLPERSSLQTQVATGILENIWKILFDYDNWVYSEWQQRSMLIIFNPPPHTKKRKHEIAKRIENFNDQAKSLLAVNQRRQTKFTIQIISQIFLNFNIFEGVSFHDESFSA